MYAYFTWMVLTFYVLYCERFKQMYPIRLVHPHEHTSNAKHIVSIFVRSQSFYDFYGNTTTQVRNIYGVTISSFIVDINFTHWIATAFFGILVFSAAHLLRCYVRCLHCYFHEHHHELVCCLAYVWQNTQQSNQLKHSVFLDKRMHVCECGYLCPMYRSI